MTLPVQFLSLGMMFGCGGALGIVFDIYRVLTGQLRIARWLIPFLDLLYWTAGTIAVFTALDYSNHGQVRVFVFIGLLAGITFHFAFTSRATVRLVLLSIRFARMLARFVMRMIDIVIVTPILALYKLFTIFAGFLLAVAIFLYKIVLQLVYPLWRLLKWPVMLVYRRLKWPSFIVQAVGRIARFIRRLFQWKR